MIEQPGDGLGEGKGFICHTCGQYHPELPMDVAVDEPYPDVIMNTGPSMEWRGFVGHEAR